MRATLVARKLVASIKMRIVKPLDRDWTEVGPQLRALSSIAHRVLNGTMTRLALAAERPEIIPNDWRSELRPHAAKNKGGKISAYRMTAESISRANADRIQTRSCAWCAGSGVEPSTHPPKKKRSKTQPNRAPGDVCSKCDGKKTYVYGDAIAVPSAIQLGWCRLAERRHKNDRGDVLAGRKTIASFRSPAPIAVTSSGSAFAVRKDLTGYVIDVPLYPGGVEGRVRFAVAPDGRGAWAHLKRIVDDGATLGDLKIISSKKKWIAIISYSWDETETYVGSNGIATIGLSDDDGSPELRIAGRRPKRLYEGSSIEHARRAFAARRASRSRHQRDIGAGARGHGRRRALEHFHAVDDAEQRWIKSISQDIAAKAVREAKVRGVRSVVIDPAVASVLRVGVLTEALAWTLKKNGFADPQAIDLAASDGGTETTR